MIVEVLLVSLWQGALITAIAAVIAMLVPRQQAGTRYAVWLSALLALAILPAISVWHPEQTYAAVPNAVIHTTSQASTVSIRAAQMSGSWLMYVWLAGVFIGFARLTLSYVRIHRILRTASPAPSLGDDVKTCEALSLPIAAGFITPVVVVPGELTRTMDRDELEAIVQHERAHIRRMDIAANLVQRLIEAVFFFNPFVYIISRQLVRHREIACDDWAVHFTGDPDRYASSLAHVAQAVRGRRSPLLTPSAIGSKHMLVDRIARLLNGKVSQLKINYVAVGATVASFALLAFLLQTPNGLASVNMIAANQSLPSNCWSDVKVLQAAAPVIPESVLKAQGKAEAFALVRVGADGRVTNVTISKSSGNATIDKATIDAARQTTYSPELQKCKHVAGSYMFHVEVAP